MWGFLGFFLFFTLFFSFVSIVFAYSILPWRYHLSIQSMNLIQKETIFANFSAIHRRSSSDMFKMNSKFFLACFVTCKSFVLFYFIYLFLVYSSSLLPEYTLYANHTGHSGRRMCQRIILGTDQNMKWIITLPN